MQEDTCFPADLAAAHPFVTATWYAAAEWWETPDGRLMHWPPEPGIIDLRVSRAQLARALRLVQTLIEESSRFGLDVATVNTALRQRAGIGIGRPGQLTPIRIEERRRLVPFSDDRDLGRWWDREDELRERGWVPEANGNLRVLLPRRYDRPAPDGGWQSSFSDQDGRCVEEKIEEIVSALAQRASTKT